MQFVIRTLDLSAANSAGVGLTYSRLEYSDAVNRALQGRYESIVEIESGLLKLHRDCVVGPLADEIIVELEGVNQGYIGEQVYQFRLLSDSDSPLKIYKADFRRLGLSSPVGLIEVALAFRSRYGPLTLRNPRVIVSSVGGVVAMANHGLATGDVVVIRRTGYTVTALDVDTFRIDGLAGDLSAAEVIVDKYNFSYSLKLKIGNVDPLCRRE